MEGTVTLGCKAVNNLLETYPDNDVTAKTEVNLKRITQPPNKRPTEYAEAQWNKAPV